MKKKFSSGKISIEKIVTPIMRVVLILFALYLAFMAFKLAKYYLEDKERKKEALNQFNKVYEYVKANEDVFMEFYEYQYSLIGDIEDGKKFIFIEHEGDMQDKRDIVFQYFHTGRAGYDNEGIFYTSYSGYCYPSYDMTLWITKDIGNKWEEHEQGKKINDDMYIFMLREH